jgi:hypothetical protein
MSESEQKPELRKSLTERDNRINELEKELSDNRKVIASNGMTIGELRKEVERLKAEVKYQRESKNHPF